jgi:hypothetical protein
VASFTAVQISWRLLGRLSSSRDSFLIASPPIRAAGDDRLAPQPIAAAAVMIVIVIGVAADERA